MPRLGRRDRDRASPRPLSPPPPHAARNRTCAPAGRTPRFCLGFPVKSEARLQSLPAPPSGLARGCRGSAFCPPTADRRSAGTEDSRVRGPQDYSRKRKAARRTSSWDCSGSQDNTTPHFWRRASGQRCPVGRPSPLFSLFFGGRNFGISMRTPQGGGQLGPHPSPCHTPVPLE